MAFIYLCKFYIISEYLSSIVILNVIWISATMKVLELIQVPSLFSCDLEQIINHWISIFFHLQNRNNTYNLNWLIR